MLMGRWLSGAGSDGLRGWVPENSSPFGAGCHRLIRSVMGFALHHTRGAPFPLLPMERMYWRLAIQRVRPVTPAANVPCAVQIASDGAD